MTDSMVESVSAAICTILERDYGLLVTRPSDVAHAAIAAMLDDYARHRCPTCGQPLRRLPPGLEARRGDGASTPACKPGDPS
jgi:hypothetical protein